MKQKRENMKTREVRRSRQKLRHVDGDVPLSMRRNGEEYKDSSKKGIEDSSSKNTAEANQHAVAKICAAARQKQRKCENRRKPYFLLCYENFEIKGNSSERIEEMERELEGY